MSLDEIPTFKIIEQTGARITLQGPQDQMIYLFALEQDIIRVLVLPEGKLRFPRTWAIAPGVEDVPLDGRDRFDLEHFTTPAFVIQETPEQLQITTERVRLSIRLNGFFCCWEIKQGDQWTLAAADRATQSYNFGWWDDRVYHYLKREPDEMYFGLGERAGDTNRAGKSYRLTNLDAMGYSARSTDPLYKHIPFYLTWKRQKKIGFGLFYDTVADCTFDFGRELDNYHGHYRYFVADHGDLDYYFIAGTTLAQVVRRYTWLTGRPAFTPKWGLGYSGSTMAYTDAPNAQEQMNEFLDRCQEHDILCDSFHLSSGYTSIDGKRYVFNWDRDKFPDPAGFVRHFLEHGVRLCPNIKPCLLRDHPRFDEANSKGLFVHEPNGKAAMVQFWDDVGAYLDFTNPATVDWWKASIKDALLQYGIAATWNDNNEFEILSPTPQIHGFGRSRRAVEAKVLQTLLMIRASHEAQREFAAAKRPFLVSRSGAVGMHRYVQTWSGDNYTSWESLRYNIKMGIGLALSGVSNLGHDVGGFSGPAPNQELFLRWIQFGIFLPRFSIHSWNDDGSANEPWMYPEITPYVSDLIKLRYRLIPYLYDLLWQSHRDYAPVIRPTFLDFPDDDRCYTENDDMLLGANLLVAAVVEPGQLARAVYLPEGCGWYDFWTGDYYQGARDIVLPAPWDRPPLLAKEGCVIPLNVAEQHFARRTDQRGFCIFPQRTDGIFKYECFEDDGESEAYRQGNYFTWRLEIEASSSRVLVNIDREIETGPEVAPVTLLFPRQEARPIEVVGGAVITDRDGRMNRELLVALS
ncbi:MAG: glycoside hydrolase family 31 protein [Verrucomicrobia bacterium]|nr:glycoside hydrolase family 31 protein [Verrucomicrobiota bacterium]